MRAEGVLFTLASSAALVRSITMRYNEERGMLTLSVETGAEELRSKTVNQARSQEAGGGG